jgi:hypothetical protein
MSNASMKITPEEASVASALLDVFDHNDRKAGGDSATLQLIVMAYRQGKRETEVQASLVPPAPCVKCGHMSSHCGVCGTKRP